MIIDEDALAIPTTYTEKMVIGTNQDIEIDTSKRKGEEGEITEKRWNFKNK